MIEKFDPYHEWLAIPPEDQPPDLYRLLGVRTFEDKPSVIESAADQRMGHLRTFQAGKRSAESQKLLNQVSSGRVTLLNPEKKAKYDELLRERIRLEASGSVLDDESASRHEEVSATLVGFLEAIEVSKLKEAAEERKKAKPADRKPPPKGATAAKPAGGQRKLIIGSAIGVGVLLVLVLIVWGVMSSGGPKEKPKPQDDWISDAGQQRPSSPPTKPTESKPPSPATVPDEQPAKLPVSVQAPEGERELTVDLPGGVKMEFVLIPAGEFVMGSPEAERQVAMKHAKAHNYNHAILRIPTEGPQHRVKISKPFYLGRYEVTQAQWEAVMGNNPSAYKNPMKPVEQVNWHNVQAFLAKLNSAYEKKGMRFGLPTEAQWEYACRAGTTTAYSFGDDSALLAQHGQFGGGTHTVGQAKPNAWGLYDMHGNIAEWCSDWHSEDFYAQSPPVDPVGPPTGSHRVVRGSGWSSPPENSRSAYRDHDSLGPLRTNRGFRLALVSSDGATSTIAHISKPTQRQPTPEPTKPDTTVAATTPPEPTTPTETRLAVPPAAEQQKKIEQLNELYEFSKRRTPPERLKLANELYALAKKYKGGSAEKFVLLRKAMEFARTGGDAELMLEIVDTMRAEFQVDLLPAKQKVLADFVSGTPSTDQIGAFIRAADPVIDQALAEGRCDIALNIAEGAYRLSQQSAGREFRKQTYDRRSEVRKLAASWKKIQDAQAVLKTNPDDADANLMVGRWLCFERNDWPQGLPLLAKCSSQALQGPARQETTSPPTTPDAQVALADTWWGVAEKAQGNHKNAMMLHAGEWYTKANAGLLEGFVKIKVQKRLAEIAKIERPTAREPSQPSQPRPAPRGKHWDPTTAKLLRTLQGHTQPLKQVSFSPQGAILASASHDRTVRLWDATTGRLRATLQGHQNSVDGVAFSPDGATVVSASRDKTLRFWSVATGQLRRTLEHTAVFSGLALSPDGATLASRTLVSNEAGGVHLWDVGPGRIRHTLEHPGGVYAFAFSPNGSILATGCTDSNIRLWDVRSGQLRGTLTEHRSIVCGVAFSPNGLVLASGGYDRKVRIWDVGTGQVRFTLEGHAGYVYEVAFSPDGSTLASASRDKTVRFWDPATGRLQHTLQTGTEELARIAFSSDGSMLATAAINKDKTIKIWGFSETTPAAPASKRPSTQTGTSKLPKQQTIDLPGGVKMEFVLIPAGEFLMGSSDAERQSALEQAKAHNDKWAIDRIPSEGPQHRVKISKPLYLGKYEVTQAQWEAVMGNNPSQFKDPMNPVEKVSWEDIQQFLAKLNVAFEKKGMVFGLPTEAGWEYAYRAGTTTAFYFGDNPALLAQHGWFKDNSGGKTHPVGQGEPNAWGLYDMHGNVWEWCSDWYGKDSYAQSPPVDPVGPSTGSYRVHRGGSWLHPARYCRAAFRGNYSPGHRYSYVGCRLALVLAGK